MLHRRPAIFWQLLCVSICLCLLLVGCKKFDKQRAEKTHLELIGVISEIYESAHGEYPVSIDAPDFQQFIQNEKKEDQWGTPVRYEGTTESYSVRSAGSDTRFETEDDICYSPELKSEQIDD